MKLSKNILATASFALMGLAQAQTAPAAPPQPGHGGMRPPMMDAHPGMQQGMHRGHERGMAGDMIGGGMRERGMEHMLWAIDATPEQRAKLKTLREKMQADAKPLHDQLAAGRKRGAELYAAPTIDRAAIEKLRQDQFQVHEKLSKLRTEHRTASAEVLTPAQRAKLAERMKQRMQQRGADHHGHGNGHMGHPHRPTAGASAPR